MDTHEIALHLEKATLLQRPRSRQRPPTLAQQLLHRTGALLPAVPLEGQRPRLTHLPSVAAVYDRRWGNDSTLTEALLEVKTARIKFITE